MKSKLILTILLIVAALFSGWPSGWQQLSSAADTATDTVTVTDLDLIRNGDFALSSGSLITAWSTRGGAATNAQIEATADPQGGPAVKIFTNGADPSTASAIFQEIHLPTTVNAATLSFNVRVVQSFDSEPPQPGEVVNGWIAIVPVSGETPPDPNAAIVSGGIFSQNVGTVTDWLQFSAPLDQTAIDSLNNARSAGQRLVFMLGTLTNGFRLSLIVDNVSLKVSGSRTVPNFVGEIAFVDGKAVKRINPNNSATQTVWTHPSDTPELYSVRWKPDAGELAIASDHEKWFSPLSVDIYGVRPDGSNLRRITNAPSQAEIAAGNYGKGSVRINVFNNISAPENFSPFVISLRGAADLVSFNLPPYQQTAQVTVDNVADLGGDQAVLFIYSSASCGANSRDTGGFVDIVAGQTVEVNLTFNATNCNGLEPYARELSWKRDGAEIGYVLNSAPYVVAAAGSTSPGTPWFGQSGLIETVSWSPINDQVLYDPCCSGGGIFVRDVTGGAESRLIDRGTVADPNRPAWLPDGSGFLYILGNDIFFADAQGQNQQRLTFFAAGERAERVSPSPDGSYLVFERKLGTVSSLWIMERANPANMWQLTAGSKPDWSRVNPGVANPPTHTPTATSPSAPPTATPTSTPTSVPPGNERVYLPAVQR